MKKVDYGSMVVVKCLMIGADSMKRIYKRFMFFVLASLFILSGCSSNDSSKVISPKQVLSDAVKYSNQLEAFHEEFDDKVITDDATYHTFNDTYVVFPSQEAYLINFQNTVGGSYNMIYISKYTQTDLTYVQGTSSSTSFRDITINDAYSFSERNEVYIDKKYFTSMFESLIANDVSDYVSFEMEKNDDCYLITITFSDMEKFNEVNKEKYIEKYGEDLFNPFLEFCMTVQIKKGFIQQITWDEKRNWDGVIQERDSIATYTPCSIEKINTNLIDDLVNQTKSNVIGEGSYLTLDGLIQ